MLLNYPDSRHFEGIKSFRDLVNILPVTSFDTRCKMVRYSADERTFIVEKYFKDPNPFARFRRGQCFFHLRVNKALLAERTTTSLVRRLHN